MGDLWRLATLEMGLVFAGAAVACFLYTGGKNVPPSSSRGRTWMLLAPLFPSRAGVSKLFDPSATMGIKM